MIPVLKQRDISLNFFFLIGRKSLHFFVCLFILALL